MSVTYNADIFIGGDSGNAEDLYVTGGTLTLGGTYTVGWSVFITTGGTIRATSASTNLNIGTDLFIGFDVAGVMNIANGATVNVPGAAHIAANAGSTGTLNIGAASGQGATAAGTLNVATITFGAGNGLIYFNHTDANYTFGAGLDGNGTLEQAAGTTHLTGDSSAFSGTATVSGGTLDIDGDFGIGAVSVGAGGTLGGQGATAGSVSIAGGGTLSQTQGNTLSLGSLTLGDTSSVSVTLGAPDVGPALFSVAGALTLDGVLTVASSGAFDYGTYALFTYGTLTDNGLTIGSLPVGFNPGDWAIEDSANTISLVVATGAGRQYWDGAGTTADSVVDGGSGVWDGASTNWTNSAGTINAPWASEGAVFAGAAGGTVTVNGTQNFVALQFNTDGYRLATGTGGALAIASSTDTTLTVNAPSAEIDVAISGTQGAVKLGTGTLTLSRGNTYTGLTTVQAGTLALSGSGAIAASSGVSVATGATFDISAVTALATIASLTGTGGVNVGTKTLAVGDASNASYSGAIAGTGTLTKQGSGTFSFSGTTQNLSAIDVNAGTLATSGAAAIGDATQVNLVSGATLAVSGAETIGALSGTGGSVTLTGALTTSSSADTTFAGAISGANGSLVKGGTGTLTLSGANTYGSSSSTATTIAGGTLAVNGGSITHAGANVIVASTAAAGTLEIVNGSVTDKNGLIGNVTGSTGTVIVGAGGSWHNSSLLELGLVGAAVGTLTIQDGGTVTSTTGIVGLTATSTTLVTVTGAGSQWTNDGKLTIGNASSGAGTARLTISDGAMVTADTSNLMVPSVLVGNNGTIDIGAAAGNAAVAAGTLNAPRIQLRNDSSKLNFNHTSSITFSSDIAITAAGSIEVRSGTTVLTGEISGNFAGTGKINVYGGTLELAGDDTSFTGTTTLSGGTLKLDTSDALGIGGSLGYNPLAVTGHGTVVLADGISIGNGMSLSATADVSVAAGETATFASRIMGTGALAKVGGGTLVLTASNSYSGGTGVEDGVLRGSTASIQGNVTLSAPGVLLFDQSSNGVFAGSIGGTGTVQRTGTGELKLSGSSTYTGTTEIGAGTIELATQTSAGASTIEFSSSGASVLRIHDFSLTNTLAGFGADDVIDLQDMVFTAPAVSLDRVDNTLTVTQGGTTITLVLAGLDADHGIGAFADGDGSTLLKLVTVNHAPALDLDAGAAGTGTTLAYTEQAAASAIAANATVADADSADFQGGSLTVSFSANGTADDELAIRSDGTGAGQIGAAGSDVTYGGVVIGTVAGGGDLVITFTTRDATPQAVQALVRAITFHNGSEAPSTAPRSVDFTLVDGDGVSGGGADTTVASATIDVSNTNDAPTGSVAITGAAQQNETLTADTGTLADADGLGTLHYQWMRGADLVGTDASTYVLTEADVGFAISVRVSYTDGDGGDESVTSAPSALVANVNDAPAGALLVSGTATQGQVLTADASGVSDADGLGTFTYQWLRGGVAIGGATSSTYTLTQADVGAAIAASITYTDGHGTVETVTSAGTAAVLNVNDPVQGTLTISGTAVAGRVLTAQALLTDDDGLGTFTYQWNRDGTPIAGANGSTYSLHSVDVGTTLSVSVSYTDGMGTPESVTSAGTLVRPAPVEPEPSGVLVHLPPEGGVAEGSPGDDTLIGNVGQDTFHPGAGSDTITGGDGLDTVVFTGARDGYTITHEDDGSMTVRGPGSVTHMDGIERLVFADGRFAMDTNPADLDIVNLYLAGLARQPDEGGLRFYVDVKGQGVSLWDMASSFVHSDEFQSHFGAMGDRAFVESVYHSALGRDADADGLAFWLDVLAQLPDGEDRAALLVGFVQSPEMQARIVGMTHDGVELVA